MTGRPKRTQILVNVSEDMFNDLKETASRSGMTTADFTRHAIMWALYGAEPQGVDE